MKQPNSALLNGEARQEKKNLFYDQKIQVQKAVNETTIDLCFLIVVFIESFLSCYFLVYPL